jgi:hypothetical protein
MDPPATGDLEQEQDALDQEPAQKPVDQGPEEIRVSGTTQLSFFKTGGKQPQSGKLTIQGVSGIPIMGGTGFKKGEFIHFEGVARVEEVGQKDKMDRKANQAVDCVQKHMAYATDVRLSPATSAHLPDEDDAAAGETLDELADVLGDLSKSAEDRVEAALAILG